jgi:hypothetical protein
MAAAVLHPKCKTALISNNNDLAQKCLEHIQQMLDSLAWQNTRHWR